MADIAPPALDAPHEDWLVYADALQNAGDARGELISLSAAAVESGDSKALDAYLEAHAEEIFGSLAAQRGKLEIEWRYDVPESLSLKVGPKDEVAKLFGALLASPLAARMRKLRIVAQTPRFEQVELGPGIAQLAKGLPASCTELELIDERAKQSRMLVSADYSPGNNLVDFGSLDAVWAIPQLRRLHVYVADPEQLTLGSIDAAQLRDFGLFGLRWGQPYGSASDLGRTLGAAKWPQLRRLALRIPETYTYSWPEQYGAYVPVSRYDEPNEYYDDYGEDGDDGYREDMDWSQELGAMLRNLATTELTSLSLTSFCSGANLLEALHEHGLPPSLERLDLSGSDLNDENVAWLVEHAGFFAQLESLDLSDTLISDAEALSALDTEVLHSSGGGARYQFSVGME